MRIKTKIVQAKTGYLPTAQLIICPFPFGQIGYKNLREIIIDFDLIRFYCDLSEADDEFSAFFILCFVSKLCHSARIFESAGQFVRGREA